MKSYSILAASVLTISFATLVQAKTIVISDIDDTLKVSHVLALPDGAAYVEDTESRFLGMSEVLQNLKRQDPQISFTYLSRGPTWLISSTHKSFLKNGKFPDGQYIGRTNLPTEVHKAVHIREILQREKPQTVVLIGDNGEIDPLTYHQIFEEYKNSGIQIFTYIHTVYDSRNATDPGSIMHAEQIGFASAIELSMDLTRHGLVSPQNTQALITMMMPQMLSESGDKYSGTMVWSFFSNCSDFVWRWDPELTQYKDLKPVRANLLKKCGH